MSAPAPDGRRCHASTTARFRMLDSSIPRALGAALLAAALAAPAAAQQRDTLLAAGPEYAAGGLHQWFLGDDYRPLWAAPVRVPFLDLGRHAGGLTPVERGGGQQTRVLHLVSAEGYEYVFRSVNKSPSLADEPALRNTLIADAVEDQVSSLHPGAALVVAPLLEAVGVPHATPQLVVMPDDPRLGEFRHEFAGLLGWIEERPDERQVEGGDDRPGFGGYPRVIGTDRLLERLEEGPEDRVDARAYLTARLVDLVVNDWDRHYDQWRWAETERGDTRVWLPIPRDRDYAFVDYDGVFMELGRNFVPNAVRFTPEIENIPGLTLNARPLDRELLAELERPVWDSVAAFVQARLTDPVIDAAVAQLPPEYERLSGERLRERLRTRRASLPLAAVQFYRRLAGQVDVLATDERDLAVVDRVGEGLVELRIHDRDGDATEPTGAPYYRRLFRADETTEVRLYLRGGDDYAVVRGDVGESLLVRVIGGGGDDVLVDSSVVRGDRYETAFYDERGENRLVAGRETRISTRPYQPPERVQDLAGESARDWGSSFSVRPVLDYRNTDGLIVGAGPVYTRYGFRRSPYAYRVGASARVGLSTWNPAVEAFGQWYRVSSPWGFGFQAEASKLLNFRFYGLGNDTPVEADRSRYTIAQDQVSGTVYLTRDLAGLGELQAGPIFKYTNPDTPEGYPLGALPRYGNGGFAQLGVRAQALVDGRDSGVYPRSGTTLHLRASGYPGLLSADGAFGSVFAAGTTYLTAEVGRPLTLALRAGGERVWGPFPVHEAAFLGGSRTVRGYAYQRYAGEASLFGNAELRAPIGEVPLLLLRGRLGALALADAGRVYAGGESPGGWHTAYGGGLWFLFEIRETTFALTGVYAQGNADEPGRAYVSFGMPF